MINEPFSVAPPGARSNFYLMSRSLAQPLVGTSTDATQSTIAFTEGLSIAPGCFPRTRFVLAEFILRFSLDDLAEVNLAREFPTPNAPRRGPLLPKDADTALIPSRSRRSRTANRHQRGEWRANLWRCPLMYGFCNLRAASGAHKCAALAAEFAQLYNPFSQERLGEDHEL